MIELMELPNLIANKNTEKIAYLIKKFNLSIDSGKIKVPDSLVRDLSMYWDKRQLVKKIQLNSALTGALN